ncbi:MAG: hypothetical protein LUQ25_05515 [Methanoregulaceae archaeon]|nr:hypothetical protein [Methanoregulaceae archaeon]
MTISESKAMDVSGATKDMIKRFEVENDIMVETLVEPMYWTVTVFINRPWGGPKKRNIRAKKYITAPDAKGLVFVLDNPISENTYSMETWKDSPDINTFVKQVLDAVVAKRAEETVATGSGPGCG